MATRNLSPTKPLKVMKMAADLQAHYDAFVRDRRQQQQRQQQAPEGEEPDGLVSRSTISPTSLESEAAFPSTGDPWNDAWRYPSGFAPPELPAAFDMKAPMPASQTEKYRYAAPPEDLHHGRFVAENYAAERPRLREGYGMVRRTSWEDRWDREYAAGNYAPTQGVVNALYEPVVARTEVGAPTTTTEDEFEEDRLAAERIGRMREDLRENLRVQRMDACPAVDSHVRDAPCEEPDHRPTGRLTRIGISTARKDEAARTFEPFQSSFNPMKALAYGLEELSRAHEKESASSRGANPSDAKASRHDFDYHNLVAAGKIPRAGVVDFPTSNLRTPLGDREAAPRGRAQGHEATCDGDKGVGKENNRRAVASSDQGRCEKRRRTDRVNENRHDGSELSLGDRPLPGQPFSPLTAHNWVSPLDYLTQAVNPPLEHIQSGRVAQAGDGPPRNRRAKDRR